GGGAGGGSGRASAKLSGRPRPGPSRAAGRSGLVPVFAGRGVARQAPGLAQGLAQHVFDLRIDAAQFVVGPFLHRLQHGGADAQRIGLLPRHQSPSPGQSPRRARSTDSSIATARPLTTTTSTTASAATRAWSPPQVARPAAIASIATPT